MSGRSRNPRRLGQVGRRCYNPPTRGILRLMEDESMSQATSLMPAMIPDVPSDSENFYEIVDGQRVEKRPMGTFQILIAAALDQLLGGFVRAHRLGRVAPEMLFKISPDDKPATSAGCLLRLVCKMATRSKGRYQERMGCRPRTGDRSDQPEQLGRRCYRQDRRVFRGRRPPRLGRLSERPPGLRLRIALPN